MTDLSFVSPENIRAVLAQGADPNSRTASGRTPLHVFINHPQAVEALLDAGADPEGMSNLTDSAPLHTATNLEVVRMLIDAGADLNVRDCSKRTPLHDAADSTDDWPKLGKMNLLIQAGADIDALDSNGRTPLHLAATQDVADLLIDAGANLEIRDRYGMTAGQCQEHGMDEEGQDIRRHIEFRHGKIKADELNAVLEANTAQAHARYATDDWLPDATNALEVRLAADIGGEGQSQQPVRQRAMRL